jgi:YD repeat-containing protein
MVAIVSGSGLGLSTSSLSTLGQRGLIGTASQGNNGEQAFVNIATGNLVLQDRDDLLMARGTDVAALRTYNSQGLADDDNGDNWSNGFFTRNILFTGTLNTAGSTVTRVDRDGARSVYAFDAATLTYTSTEGAGAYDVIRYDGTSGRLTWTDGNSGVIERYTASDGRLIAMSDASGNTVSYEYANGLVSRVIGPAGDSMIHSYTADGNLGSVRMLAADGTETTRTTYGYDKKGRLATVTVDLTPQDKTDSVTYSTTYTYSGNSSRVATVTQSDGTSLQFTYVQTQLGFRVATVSDGLGQVTTFTYDVTNRRTTVTDPMNRVTAFEYDAAGQLTGIVSPAVAGVPQTTSFAYSATGDLLQVTDPAGGVVAMSYDANGNQILQRDAAGNTVTRTFDVNNQISTETTYVVPDPDGAGSAQPGEPLVTRYIYDTGDDRLLRFVVSGEGRVTEHRYDAFGLRVSSLTYTGAEYDTSTLAPTDAPTLVQLTGWIANKPAMGLLRTDMTYDFRGQLQTRTEWASFDAAGNGLADGKQSVTTSVYDAAGELLQTVSPASGTTSYSYDGLGRLKSSIDALGQITLTSYDDANDSVKLTLANGLVNTQTYDKAGRLVTVTQSNGSGTVFGTSRYSYDAVGRLLMTQDPTGVRSWNLYDEAGRKVAEIDGDGSLTEYVFDVNDHVTHTIAYATPVNTALLVSATGEPLNPMLASVRPLTSSAADRHAWNAYDAAGRLLETVDASGAVTETRYDGASRVVAVIRYANLISTASLGNAPSAAGISPAASAQDRIERNFYDGDGLLRGRLDGEGYLTEYRYDEGGRLVRTLRYANATPSALRASGTLAQLIPATSSADATTIYLINAKGQVAGEVDAEGYLTERIYDANGNQSQTVRYATKVTGAIADASTVAQLRPAANAQDHATSCVYDKLNRKTQEIDAQGTVTQYTYDSAGNLTKTVRAVGSNEVRTLNTRFDLQGRLTGELTAEGALLLTGNQTQAQIDGIWSQYGLTHAYDAAGRRMSTIDQNGNKALFFYNVDGQLTHTVNALGEVVENQYNTLGQQVAAIRYGTRISLTGLTGTNAGGLVNTALTSAVNLVKNSVLDSKTSFLYNKTGTLASVTDALGFATNYVYNAFGEQASRTQAIASGQTVSEILAYDRRGLLLTDTLDSDAGGTNAQTTNRYDAFGRVIGWTDAGGNSRSATYDRLGRAVTTTDALGQGRSSSYDAFDRLLTQTDALGNVTRYQYDSAQRSMTVTTPEGISVTTSFTRLGQTQNVVDGRGNSTTFSYDKNGNLRTSSTALTTATQTYDRANRLIATTDAGGNQTTLSYDAANRLFTRTLDAGGLNLVTKYQYDAKGQQILVIDANGVNTTLTYDLQGQLKKQVVDLNGLNLTTSYTWDGRGKMLTVTQPNGNVVQYTFDKLGRRTREQTDPLGLNLTRTWTYDKLGNVTSLTDANGNVSRYAYDAQSRLVYGIDGAGDVVQYSYDAEGRQVRSVRYAKAISLTGLPLAATVSQVQARVAGSANDASDFSVYDQDGRRTATIDGIGAVVKYFYDANGNVVERVAYANAVEGWAPGSPLNPVANAALDQRVRTVYDQLNRAVFSIDGTGAVVARTYDGNGNVLSRKAYAVAANPTTAATQAALSAVTAQITSPGHDAIDRFVYDKAGRLSWSVDAVGAVTGRIYDGNGNLVRLTQYATAVGLSADPASVAASSADRSTFATYDAANRAVLTMDALGGVVRQSYDANGNLTVRRSYAKAVSPSISTAATLEAAIFTDDVNDRVERYAYDAANRQAFVIDATGAVSETRYDGAGNAIQSTRFERTIGTVGLTSSSTATTVDSLITRNSNLDRTVSRAFDGANRLVYTVDPLGYVTQSVHDGVGRTTKTVLYAKALSERTATTLAAIGQAIEARPAEDRIQSCTYDSAGRQLTCMDALGFVQKYEYNALGEKTSFTNATLDEWQYEYDAAGRMVKEISPEVGRAVAGIDAAGNVTFEGGTIANANIVTLMAYDALGNLLSRTEAAGLAEERVTRYGYDALGRQVITTYPAVGVYHLGSDSAANGASGLAARVDTPQVLTTTTVYNALGDAIAGTDLAGNYSYKAYDKLGHVTYDVDAMGFAVKYERNAFGEVSKLTRYAQGITLSPGVAGLTQVQVASALVLNPGIDRSLSTEYDRAGRVARVTEPQALAFDSNLMAPVVQASKVTENSYNAFGELTRSLVAGEVATFHYFDRSGQEIATVDAGGYLTTQKWDGAGQVLERTEYATALAGWMAADPALSTPPAASLSPDDRTTRWAYDRAGRKISETRVNVEVSGNTQLYARADGTLTISAPTPVVPTAVDNTPAGTAAIPGVIFQGGADGSGVLQWPTPTSGLHAEVRWRVQNTEVWNSASDLITSNGSTQQLFIAADFPRGTYQVELLYANASGAVTNLRTGTLYFPAPQGASVALSGSAPTSNVAGIAGVIVTQRDGVNVLQWPAPESGAIATLRFQWPNTTEWVDAAVQSAGAVQFVVIPDGLAAGNYKVQLDFSRFNTSLTNLVTSYRYDALGNLTGTTDALGAQSHTYYDTLGRVVAIATAATGSGLTPLTEFFRDAHGDVVGQMAWALGAASATDAGYVRAAPDAADRFEGSRYDALGRMTQSTDAQGVSRFYSYSERGDLAKSWFEVADGQGGTTTIYEARDYDKLGRLAHIYAPAPAKLDGTATAVSTTFLSYNAFGEMTGRNVDGMPPGEYFEYDNAGRLWKTNAGDGVDRIMLYDVLGRMTKEVRSAGIGGGNANIVAMTADQAAGSNTAGVRVTINQYDALGRLVKQTLPQTLATASGIAVSDMTLGAVIVAPADGASSINRVDLSWTSLASLGTGDIKVVLSYTSDAAHSITRIFSNEEAAAGAMLEWDAGAEGGITSVTGLALFKKDVLGYWQSVVSQAALSAGAHNVTIPAPLDPTTQVILQSRPLVSTGPWLTLSTINFGDKLYFDTAGLPYGSYEYRVQTQRSSDSDPFVTSTGTLDLNSATIAVIAAPITSGGTFPEGVYGWQSPGAGTTSTLRYRVAGSTEVWRSLTVVSLGGGFDGVDTSLLAPGTYEYELLYSHTGDLSPYAHATGQITKVASVGTPPLQKAFYKGNDDGTWTISWPAVPNTTPAMRWSVLGSGRWSDADVNWTVVTDNAGVTHMTTPVITTPGQYSLELSLLDSSGAVVNFSSGTLNVTQGIVAQAEMAPNTPVYAPAVGYPPLPGLKFDGVANGDWTLTWPLSAAGVRTEIWARPSGSAAGLQPLAFTLSANGATQVATVLAATLATGTWDIELRQVNSIGARIYQNDGALTVNPDSTVPPTISENTPKFKPAENFPDIKPTFTANADGRWSMEWLKPTDSTWTTTFRYRRSGTSDPWTIATIQNTSLGTQKVDFSATQLAKGSWEIELFESSGTTRMAQSLSTVTVNPPMYAAAALSDTTVVYQPALHVSVFPVAVPGLTWIPSGSGGSTFSWTAPPAGSVMIVNYRPHDPDPTKVSGAWSTLNTMYYSGGSPQSVTITPPGLAAGNWDVQISQVNLATGVADAMSSALLTVSSTKMHTLARTWPPLPDVQFTTLAGGGAKISWLAPTTPRVTAHMSFVLRGSGLQPSEANIVTEGTRQTVTIPSDFWPGQYDVEIVMVDDTGTRTARSTGVITAVSGGFGDTWLNTTPPYRAADFAVTQGAPEILTTFATSASDGSWSLQWATPPTGSTTSFKYRLVGTTTWLDFSNRVLTSGSVQKASFVAADLAPGNYELDVFFTKNSLRTGQFKGKLSVSSVVPTKAVLAFNTPTYVPAENYPPIPATYTSNPADGTWRLTWPAPPAGSTILARWLPPGATEWTDFSAFVQPDGSNQFLTGAAGFAPGVYKIDVAYIKDKLRTAQYTADLAYPNNKVAPTLTPVDSGYRPAENLPYVPGAIFTPGQTDGSWTLTWPHPPAGKFATLNYRATGTTEYLPIPFTITTANGIDSITVHNWDWTAGSYDLDLFYSDAATGLRTDQLQGMVTMHTVPRMEPQFTQDPVLYVPTQYLISQTTDPVGGIISVAQTFVVSAAPTGEIPGVVWMNTNDGGSVFRWNSPPSGTTAVFRYRVLGGSTWTTYPISPTPDGQIQQAVVAPTFPPGQYVAELTLTKQNSDGTFTVTGYVSGTLYVPVPTATQDLAGLSQPTATESPLDNLQAIISQKLDRWGNVLEVSDPRNKNWVTRYRYNANNQVVEQTQPDAGAGVAVTQIRYDALGREIAVQDANGHVADEKKWDAVGNLVQEIHADGGILKYSYSIFGDKIQATDELGRVTEFAYDKLSRLVRTTYAAVEVSHLTNTGTPDWLVVSDGQQRLFQTIAYDQAGRKTSETGTDGRLVIYRYDLRGNIVQTTQTGINTWFEYDTQGRKTGERDGNDAVATWRFDYFGQLTAHTDIGGARYSYAYDNARQLLHQGNDRAGLAMNIGYNYDAAGRLIHITDGANFEDVTYAYDLAGNRIREKTVQRGVVYQDNHLAYDTLGRLKWVADGRAFVTMDYDRVGNRTHIATHVTNGDADQDSDRWFQYDAMNRQVVADAADEAGRLGSYGHAITYNKAGEKTSDKWQGNVVSMVPGTAYTESTGGFSGAEEISVTANTYKPQLGETIEKYEYDALGRLIAIDRDGTVVDQRNYDAGSRTIKSGKEGLSSDYLAALNGTNDAGQVLGGNGSEVRKSLYDANGRLLSERVVDNAGVQKYQLFYTNESDNTARIDAAGNLLGYTISAQNVDRFTYTLERREGYKQTKVHGTRNETAGHPGPTGDTINTYDANGFLTAVTDTDPERASSNRTFVNDVAGNVLYANQAGHVQRQLVANGEVLGRYGEVVNDKEPKSNDGTPVYTTAADFSFGFQPTGGDIKDAAPSSHVVGAGDTLQSIAQMSYGDSRLWYVVAEANGLAGNQDLRAGQVLKIPATESSANAADTFRPYDPSKVVGDTSPFLPAPAAHGGGCGGIGQILTAIVVIAVVVVTQQYELIEQGVAAVEAAGEVAASAVSDEILASVGAATSGGSFTAGAIAGAAGSLSGQLVGNALGIQDGFSFRQMALSALSGGIGGGLSGIDFSGSALGNAIARAAIGNTLTQGIGVVTGLQKRFDWKSVAASAAGTAVGEVVGGALSLPQNGQRPSGMSQSAYVANSFVKGFAAGTTAALMHGGRVSVQQVATDAFGNAIGQGLANGSSSASAPAANTPFPSADGIFAEAAAPEYVDSAFADAVRGYSQGGIDDYEGTDVAALSGRIGIGLRMDPTLAEVGGTGLRAGGGLGLTASSSGLSLNVNSESGSPSIFDLGSRFLRGAFYGAVNMVWQPVAQTLDLGQASLGLLSAGKYEPTWLSGVSRNYAAGMSYGETVLRAVAGSNPFTAIGPAAYDLTSSGLQGDWGGVAESLGGIAGSLGVIRGGQRYFAHEVVGSGLKIGDATDAAGAGGLDAAAAFRANFIGPRIGKSGYLSMRELADAGYLKYQSGVDDGYAASLAALRDGTLRVPRGVPEDTVLGASTDRYARAVMNLWADEEGVAQFAQINRYLRDPSGSGRYRIPDLSFSGQIYDATLGRKWFGKTPQVNDFYNYSGGSHITIVRPTLREGSYSLLPPH